MVPWIAARGQTAVGDGTEVDEFSMEAARADTPPRKLPRVNGHSVNLPTASDLKADGERSMRERIPVLLFFDLWDCPYCDRALKQFLVPMSTGDEWSARAVYRQVEIDKPDRLIDFNGHETTHRALAKRYEIKVTPTIHVVNARGEPLGRPLLGLMTPDFYGAYLERAITDATAQLQPGASANP